MKKKIIISLFIITSFFLLSGCSGEKIKVENKNDTEFSVNDFKTGILENYESKSELKLESRYAIGYMYAESFSVDEYGTFTYGVLKVSGRAFDPADFGDETIQNGRIYSNTITKSSDMNLELTNGSSVSGFYTKYFEPLKTDSGAYEFSNIDENNGQIIFENTDVKKDSENGITIFIHEYTYYSFAGNKKDYKISNGEIRQIKIKSYIDISNKMDDFINAEFGNRFVYADIINQTLGDDFLKGVFLVEEFMVDYN